MIAAIRVRGQVNLTKEMTDTLRMLRLFRKNYCVVVEDSPTKKGMLLKAKDYLTWGPLDEETKKLLMEKPGKEKGFFRMNSPRKGYGRKGVKVPFARGGALGNRGEKINDLIKRML
jgi:large subunit ribosomal protein L30